MSSEGRRGGGETLFTFARSEDWGDDWLHCTALRVKHNKLDRVGGWAGGDRHQYSQNYRTPATVSSDKVTQTQVIMKYSLQIKSTNYQWKLLGSSPPPATPNKVVNFSTGKEPGKTREKYLTAKYGSHQMSLIRKRLKVEMWMYDKLQEICNIQVVNTWGSWSD